MNDFMKGRNGADELTVVLGFAGIIIAMIGSFMPMQWREQICRRWKRADGSALRYWTEAIVLLALFVVSVLFMINASYRPFLYFQF